MQPRVVFVFGSNRAGRHGAGSAKHALDYWGARWGVGEGPTGDAYALPTKSGDLDVLPLSEVGESVRRFVEYARANPGTIFRVVDVGCGLAGYDPTDVAPFFVGFPSNVEFTGMIGSLARGMK